MKRSLVAIIAFGAFFLTSCMDIETSKQLDRISEMNTTIDSIEVVFKEHRLDTLAKLSLSAYSVENRIKNNYYSDTISIEFSRKMDAFKVMRRNFAPLGKSMGIIPKSIEEARSKLKELQADIENGNGKREKYEEFVAFEDAKVGQLRTLLKEYVDTKNASVKTYEELYNELNDFSMSLLKK